MPIDTDQLRRILDCQYLSIDERVTISDAADYIETLRRQLNEAHAHNQDSERINWLEDQSHIERSDTSHRSYYVIPRICSRRDGFNAKSPREAVDSIRRTREDHE